MDEALLAAYRGSAYRVRLPHGGTAAIRIDQPLPPPLQQLAGPRSWGLITAWNPRSHPLPVTANRAAQHRLLAEARTLTGVSIHAAVGVGTDGWREPSLWLIGIEHTALDELGDRYHQQAWLYGCGNAPAQLCLHR